MKKVEEWYERYLDTFESVLLLIEAVQKEAYDEGYTQAKKDSYVSHRTTKTKSDDTNKAT